jgi:hypothetical protein
MTTDPTKTEKRQNDLLAKRLAFGLLMLCALGFAACSADVGEEAELGEGTAEAALEAEIEALLREHPDATRYDERSISWDDGKVVLVLPDPRTSEGSPRDVGTGPESVANASEALTAGQAHGCPSGWYCVYEHANWDASGRRLQFSDCTRNDLSNYGFRDKTSSWVNNGQRKLAVWNAGNALRSDAILWRMEAQSISSWVGSAANDKADFFSCQ